jgi:hypothetical protein
MKFTVAATLLASSVTATAVTIPIPDGGSLSNDIDKTSHRPLAVSMKQRQDDIKGILKDRHVSKKANNVIRHLQDKLKRSKLRNQDVEDSGRSHDDLDLGLFSRNLQQDIEIEDASMIQGLVNICSVNAACSCPNVDVDTYTAKAICSFDEYCYTVQDVCTNDAQFCYESTYELEVTAPRKGSSKLCWGVTSPLVFTYCYGLKHSGVEGSPDSCYLEINGQKCNSCDFVDSDVPGTYCTAFDCTNVDEYIYGTECSDVSIVKTKVEDHLIYAPLPCDDGCNICPQDGDMTSLNNFVTYRGEEYSCLFLNLFGLAGKFNETECNALPSLVNGPCGCDATPPPVNAPISEEVPSIETNEAPVEDTVDETIEDAPVEDTVEETTENSDEALNGSAASRFGNGGFAIVAVVTSIFSWTMM